MAAADTIFALASGTARSAVAIIRVSGPDAERALSTLASTPAPAPPRRAVMRTLRGRDGAAIDQALVLWFPGPFSFTGEDVAEFQVHGGAAIIRAVSDVLAALGLRPAEPGEFTRRAFENGRLDLTQAEAVADLVDAETDAQRRQALRQLDGELGALYAGWRERIIEALALLEAEIDFPDEGDVPTGLASRATPALSQLAAELAEHLRDDHRGERIREGFRIAIIGAPNVGKSSLINRLARRDAAIVTDVPGTTRDIVEARLSLGGHLVIIQDTAGLRDTDDVVEIEGVSRARRAAQDADLRIGVADAGRPETLAEAINALNGGDVLWINKADLGADAQRAFEAAPSHVERLCGSALTGDGLDALEAQLGELVATKMQPGEAPSLTRARHRHALQDALAALERAAQVSAGSPELAGEDVRIAARAIGAITGAVDVEEILDRIFADFCIGK